MNSSVLLLLLLVFVGTSYAATHVNISIAHQSTSNVADDASPAQVHAGPYSDGESQFARLRQADQAAPAQSQQKSDRQQGEQPQQSTAAQLTPRQGLGLQPPQSNQNKRMPRPGMRRVHMRRPSMHQQVPHAGQFRQRSQQRQQNQEFERYIQSYHSHGPTVETVYETSSPAPQRYTQSSSSSSFSDSSSAGDRAPQRLVDIRPRQRTMHTFERQVALPAAAATQSANIEQDRSAATAIAPSPAIPAVSTPAVAPAPLPAEKKATSVESSSSYEPSSGFDPATSYNNPSYDPATSYNKPSYDPTTGYNKPSYDPTISYNKPSYDPNSYNYDDAPDYQDQYPPSPDDDAQGYDDYGDQGSYPGGAAYLPPHQLPPQRSYGATRPLVTKTIQIVQPALKAKKYEVRHPAIQKEFYDIEERVLIKPAGTLVVELDRPVAKIPRGETVLPLGHPHPAVADQYNTNGHINGVSQTQTFNSNSNSNNNEYRPNYGGQKENSQTTTTIGSSVTTMPSYEQTPKDEYVESQLQQQQPTDTVDDSGVKSNSNSNSDNQDQIDFKHISPNMLRRPEQVDNYNYAAAGSSSVEQPPPNVEQPPNYEQRQPQRNYQRNFNRQPYNEDYFRGEFLSNVNGDNVDAKPARLQEAPQPQQIIKHEHKIHLPPSQHNIYIGHDRQVAKERRILGNSHEQPAHVSEIKPFLKNHAGGTVVYAKAVVRPAANSGQYYAQSSHYRNPLAEDLEYSAPYSRMRFEPQQHQLQQSDKLVEEPKAAKAEEGKTHIQIKIPASDAQDKSVVIASTISPPGPSRDEVDCDEKQRSARLKQKHEQFQRLVETPPAPVPTTQATPSSDNLHPDVDVSLKSAAGHLAPNERVIAATPAPTDVAATRETFHKRRIVVNHPFQTVREVVEHEPITNYHQIQVNEPATPALYHQAAYYQPPTLTHGNLVHYNSATTHGNLYAPPPPARIQFG